MTMAEIRAGLLGTYRTCPQDQQMMDKVDGTWKFDQVEQSPNKLTTNNEWIPTGFIFTVTLYRCAKCGYVEMVDQP